MPWFEHVDDRQRSQTLGAALHQCSSKRSRGGCTGLRSGLTLNRHADVDRCTRDIKAVGGERHG